VDNRVFLSVMTPAASTGTSTFNLSSYNATPNVSITFTVTGITAGMNEFLVANTICTQASNAIYDAGWLFQGVLGLLTDPISANYQTANTGHVTSFFSQAQFALSQVADTTGTAYYIDSIPVLATVTDAMSYAPLANQLLQTCAGGQLSQQQIIDLFALASAELIGVTNNNIVSSYYIFEWTSNIANAIRFQAPPIQMYWNPYIIRPTIVAMTTDVATFDLSINYDVDYQTGWCTFKFAQDLLFNYEPFDNQNQWRCAFQGGWNYIPREIKLALYQLSYLIQTTSNISSISDGVTRVTYAKDNNITKREIFSPLRIKYML
jgi:hypothetical protein